MTERFEITADSVTQELAKIGFANIKNYLRKDGAGKTTLTVDIANCTPEQLAAIESIQYEEAVITGPGLEDGEATEVPIGVKRKVKFKLHDKKGALVDLLRYMGGQFEKDNKGPGDGPQQIIVTGGLTPGSAPDDTTLAKIRAANGGKLPPGFEQYEPRDSELKDTTGGADTAPVDGQAQATREGGAGAAAQGAPDGVTTSGAPAQQDDKQP